jgi:acetyltransferase-like isoleucine patch superfamily enzyme
MYAIALVRGHFYKIFLPLIGRRFEAGRNLRVFGRLVVRGPGRVVFGDDVTVRNRVTPFTHHPDAVITVGDSTRLVGTRFGCAQRITIGRGGRLANCHILDTDFHPTSIHDRDDPKGIRTAAVEIGNNVWVGDDNVILPGTSIGDNCVTSVMTVCSGKYPPNVVIAGNPGRAARKLDATATS